MKDNTIPGSTGFWAAVTLIAIWVWLAVSSADRTAQLGALRAELNAPRAETAAEASAADAAERLPDIAVKPGLWTREIARDGASARFDWLLREGGTFVATATATAWAGDREKFAVSAEGAWRIKGSTLVFSVASGAKGLFPASGRVAVRRATDDELVFVEGNRDAVLKHRDFLAREAAALPLKSVPTERVEGLFEREIFLKIAAGIALAALLFAGWSFARRGRY